MAQRNIDFGTFPDDPDADAIRTAFTKVQDNFTELFAGLQDQAVLSVRAGAGITVSSPTGNVEITNKFSQLTIQSSSLYLGLTSSPTAGIVTANSTLPIYIELPTTVNTITTLNVANTITANTVNVALTVNGNVASFTGSVSAGNLSSSGNANVTSNVNAGNVNSGIGNFTGNLNAANANLGNLVTANNISLSANANVSGNVNAGNVNGGNLVTANYFSGDGSLLTNVVAAAGNLIVNGGSNVSIPSASSSIRMGVAGTANVVIVNQTGVNVAGYLTSTGNLTAANANLGNAASANYFIGNFYGTANSATTATSATTAGTVTTAAQPNITSVGTLSTLSVTGNVSAGNISATGITGTTLTGSLTTNSQPNITSVGTLSSLTVTGKITAGQLQGEAGNISNVQGANVSGTVANATYAASAGTSTSATTAGTVTTNAQPNITSVGTLSSLTVTNKITAGQLQGEGGNISNIQGANVSGAVAFASTANSVAAANVSGQVSNALIAGTVYTAAQPNITSVGTLTSLAVTGNVSAGNVYANSGTIGAQTLKGEGGNISNIQGANVSGVVSSATTAGTVTTNAQPNITSVGTLSTLTVSGNITAGNISGGNLMSANYFSGDGSLLTNISVGAGSYIVNGNSEVRIDANSNVRINVAGVANVLVVTDTGANISGYANVTGNLIAGNVAASLLTGTLYTNAQPNITSLGTLTSLNVFGTANLSSIGNVKISGGSNNQVLVATGSGSDLAFVTATGLTFAPGSNTQVLFNDAGNFAANASLTFNKTTGTLSTQALSVTNSGTFGNVFANSGTIRGNLLTGTLTTNAQPNITSIGTLTSLIVNGNINAGNLSVTGVAATTLGGSLTTASQPNITSVGTLTSLGVNGTVTAANFTANTGVFTGNGSGLSAIPGANVTGTVANATYATTAGSATTAGTVTTNAQPNITSVGALTGLTVTGNTNLGKATVSGGTVTANTHAFTVLQTWNNSSVQFSALEANITDTASAANSLLIDLQVSNISKFAASKEGNVFFSGVITGNGSGLSAIAGANVTGTVANASSATTAGTVTTAAQPNITSVGTLSSLSVTGNISGANLTGNHYGNGSALSAISGANVTGTVANATFATSAGTVTTAAQPNITSVGTLTSLGVNGTVTAVNFTANTGVFTGNGNGLSSLQGSNVTGAVAFATTANSVAGANVSGAVAFATTANSVAGANVTGAVAFATTANSVAGANVTGQVANALVAGTVYTAAQSNITSVGTLTSLTVSGNIAAQANVNMSGYVIRSVGTGISAAGTTQGTATAITKEMNVVSTVAIGAGVILPTAVAGMAITITNLSANTLLVYPHSGGDINGGAANAAYSQPAGATLQFIAPTTTDWYTVGATFA